MTKRQPASPPTRGENEKRSRKTTPPRPTPKAAVAPAPGPATAAMGTTATSVAGTVAAFVGKTIGDLLNRKDELQAQLVEVESQIAQARTRVGRALKPYLPDSLPGLGKKAKKVGPKRKTAPRRTPTPPAAHGPDRETAGAAVAAHAAAQARKEPRPARPRTAPRATRRG